VIKREGRGEVYGKETSRKKKRPASGVYEFRMRPAEGTGGKTSGALRRGKGWIGFVEGKGKKARKSRRARRDEKKKRPTGKGISKERKCFAMPERRERHQRAEMQPLPEGETDKGSEKQEKFVLAKKKFL